MSKISAAVVFLVVGLAIGLWFGFNPQAHQQVEKSWSQLTLTAEHAGVRATTGIRTTQSPAATAKPAAQAKETATVAWKQITMTFNTLWSSLLHLFHTVTASISKTR